MESSDNHLIMVVATILAIVVLVSMLSLNKACWGKMKMAETAVLAFVRGGSSNCVANYLYANIDSSIRRFSLLLFWPAPPGLGGTIIVPYLCCMFFMS